MDLGVVLQCNPPASRVVELADRRRTTGSPTCGRSTPTCCGRSRTSSTAQILAATRKIVVGPMVTNPATRDWTVTASTFATLNEMYGNRTICGIGRGDSAVRVTQRPAEHRWPTLRDVHRTSSASLANGERGRVQGQPPAVPLEPPARPRRLGRRLRPARRSQLTGEVARRLHPAARRPVDRRVEHRRGARRPPPTPAATPTTSTICVAAPAYVTDGSERAAPTPTTSAAGSAGMVGNHVADIVARYGADGATCPRRSPTTSRAARATTTTSTAAPGNTHTAFVPDEIVDRFCVLGPLDEHVDRLDELRALGVDQFAVYLQHDAQGRDAAGLRGARDPGGRGTGQGQDVTAAAVSARPGAGGSAVRRALGRVALVAAAVAAVGLIWTGYKAMGAATGDVWPGTSRPLPVPTDDTTLPPFLDILRRFGRAAAHRRPRAALAVPRRRVLVHLPRGVRRLPRRHRHRPRPRGPHAPVALARARAAAVGHRVADRAPHRAGARSSWRGATSCRSATGSPGCRWRSSRPTSPSSR